MQYRIVLNLLMGLTLVSSQAFETREAATQHAQVHYPGMLALEILPENELAKLRTRQVFFPEEHHGPAPKSK